METTRWWNGTWGRLTHRDVYLRTDGATWRVDMRKGGIGGEVESTDHADEAGARARVAELCTDSWGPWKELPLGTHADW